MAFIGLVNIVKRKKILNCGSKFRIGREIKHLSVCSGVWNIDDVVYEAKAEEVTCKRCLKILAKADEDGKVKLGGK